MVRRNHEATACSVRVVYGHNGEMERLIHLKEFMLASVLWVRTERTEVEYRIRATKTWTGKLLSEA